MTLVYNSVMRDKYWDKAIAHCDPKYIAYALTWYHEYNYVDFFKSKDDAINYLMDKIGCNRTLDDYKIYDDKVMEYKDGNSRIKPLVEEKDDQLYYHDYIYDDTVPMFDPKKWINPPKTKQELREFIESGATLTVRWDDGPIYYTISNMMRVKIVMEGDQEVDVRYLPIDDREHDSYSYIWSTNDINYGRYYDGDADEYIVYKTIRLN